MGERTAFIRPLILQIIDPIIHQIICQLIRQIIEQDHKSGKDF